MYAIEPIGVVFPRDGAEAAAAVATAAEFRVPVLPRGAGTSLAGQTVGRAVVMDFSRHMNQILAIDAEARRARVQPGVVQEQLNLAAARHGLMFGPDTSTSNRATLGGMIGNNSAGSHSVRYGMTIDHVLTLDVVLSDASTAAFGPLPPAELAGRADRPTLEGKICRELPALAARNADAIATGYPRFWRQSGGYRLDRLAGRGGPGGLDLARFVVGSEGTLVTVVAADVALVPAPRHRVIAVGHFASTEAAIEATGDALACEPAAVELIDRAILELARTKLEYRQLSSILSGDPQALLFVTFFGDTEAEAAAGLDRLDALWRRHRHGYHTLRAQAGADQAALLKVRQAGLGLLMAASTGARRPLAFVEDTAVDPAVLGAYTRRFRQILSAHGLSAGFYGHCSVGCLHIRPAINLKTARGIEQVKAIADEITDLVVEFNGTLSSEHGDGRARSPFLERMYGPKLMQAFRELKRAFDPDNRMNPGNIVASPPVTEHLRYGATYKTWEPVTLLDFSSQGGYAAAVEMCNGVGECRKKLEGTMCPSYMATRDEEHSTRGRANALRTVLSGKLPPSEFTGKRLYEVMDLCLECKGCKAECPANVDMAKMKYEFLYHYYKAHGLPLRNRLFGHIARLNAIGARAPGLVNWLSNLSINRWLLEKMAGIDRRRPLPALASETFTDWFARHAAPPAAARGDVVLFHDTFLTYNVPEIGRAAVQLLEAAGYRVVLVDRKCCGRPAISKGMLDEARELARWNVARLHPYAARGVGIVGLEPSCLLTARDEWVDLLRTDEARTVARESLLLEEFLMRERARGLTLAFAGNGRKALLHGHCHQKAMVGTAPTVAALKWAGFDVTEVDSGCCGMAGSFGFEREHYEISTWLGNRRLAPAVKAASADTDVVAPGMSCRQQIDHLTGRRAKHPAEALWSALKR